MAKRLGYVGICLVEYFEKVRQLNRLRAKIRQLEEDVGMKIFIGFEAQNLRELGLLRKMRRQYDILLVRGGNARLNRKACETPEVDILTHPEYQRTNSGLDHVAVRWAAQNDVAIEINFRQILIASRVMRAKILAKLQTNVRLAQRYRAPLILSSGAISAWELRDPHCLISLALQLGLELKEARQAISAIPQDIIKRSAERQREDWIMPGVKIL
jgi:ribonuclease P/MRP protein subunit RPP1